MQVKFLRIVFLAVVLILGGACPAVAQFYIQHNLLSDGAVPADLVDPNLVNAWGLVSGPTTPWWISDNGTGRSTLYNVGTGAIPLIVTVPGAMGQQSAPTGMVFNGGTGFVVNNGLGTSPARFIFASEDGTISGFRGVPVVIAVDNSASGALYKGIAIDNPAAGNFLYATNFHAGTVDVFDSAFHPVTIPGAFTDPNLPAGYAPFGIQNLGGAIYVTYALQDADKHDDVPGEGHGFVDAFDTAGHLLRRVASRGQLNSPWGLALAPTDFGTFSNDLLAGNFGDGRIHAFDPTRFTGQGEFQTSGPLHGADGALIAIDGLWALSFGKGAPATGPTNTLFFTAGPLGEQHGVFGTLLALGGCPVHTIHGHEPTAPPSHSGNAHNHHGQHGHTVATNCPPHAPGHTPGLTADPEPEIIAALGKDGELQLFATPPDSVSLHQGELPEVQIGEYQAKVVYAGLAPEFNNLWQINVLIPDEAPAGVSLHVTVSHRGREWRSIDVVVE